MAKDDCFPHLSDLLSLTYALYLTRDTALIREAVKRGIADARKKRPDLACACQGAEADLACNSHNSLFLNSEFLNRVSSYGVAPDTLLPFILHSMGKVQPRHAKGISRALTAWNGIASRVMRRVRCKCDEQRLKEFSQQRGTVPTSRLSAEIDRLHETGLTQVLLQSLWREFSDEAKEMGLPKPADKPDMKMGASKGNKPPKRKARTTPTPDMNLLYNLWKNNGEKWGGRKLAKAYNLSKEKKTRKTITHQTALDWLRIARDWWASQEARATAGLKPPKTVGLDTTRHTDAPHARRKASADDRIRQKF